MNADPRLTPLARRSPRLMAIILGTLCDTEGAYPWDELVDLVTTETEPWKTIENTIYDLIAFGAIHKIGGYKKGADSRALKLTPLGRAWLDRERIPFLTEPRDPQPPECPECGRRF